MVSRSQPNIELLPCPFCGGRPFWQERKGGQAVDFQPVYRVQCAECHRIDMPYWEIKTDCEKQWNARADDCLRAELASARKALEEADRFMAYFAGETGNVFVGPGTPKSCLEMIRAALTPEPPKFDGPPSKD